MKIIHLALALGFAFLSTEVRAEKLVIKGSDTLGAKLVPQLAEQFKAQHPGTTFDIAAEGSTTGIAAIIDGTAQIGMSSRRAKSAEVGTASAKGVHLKPTIVAYDGIAVIVNSANPIAKTGLIAMIGKAERGPTAIDAIRKHGAAYLMAVGGAAYLVSKAIRASRVVAFADLGMEAIYEFTVKDMPVTVAVDAQGTSVHHTAPRVWQARIGKIPVLAE